MNKQGLSQRNYAKIKQFFGGKRFVYATIGTENHSANYYGDEKINKLSISDVVGCIDTARGWNGEDGWGYSDDELTEIILDDLQADRP